MKPKLSSWGLRRPSAVILIIGAPGSGKTVLAYSLADELHGERPVYCPMSEQFNRPKYYHQLVSLALVGDEGAVIMHTDASLSYHARRFMDQDAVTMSNFQAIRRHRNVDLIWDVQSSGSLDVDIIRAADCVILKEPSVLQAQTDRPAIRALYDRATNDGKECFWDKTTAYVITHEKQFWLRDIEKPSYWNERISTDDLGRAQEKEEKSIWRRLRLV